jgi:MFS family permease
LPAGGKLPSHHELPILTVFRLFLFGYDAGVMTDVIASKKFLAFFHTTSDSDIIGAINSTFNGGAVFGALQGGLTMDRFGRKLTILMGALICLVGAILQCTAQNLALILYCAIVIPFLRCMLSKRMFFEAPLL